MPTRILRVLLSLCSLLYFYLAYLLALLSAAHAILAIVITLICLGIGAPLAWLRFTRSGRSALAKSQITDWTGTFVVVVFLVACSTAGFSALSTGLYQLGVGSFKAGPLHGTEAANAIYASYLWHLADAIPVLKIPDALNWKLQHPFTDHAQGALALGYTVVVIIPLVYSATQLIVALLGEPASPTPDAKAKPEPPSEAALDAPDEGTVADTTSHD